MGKAPDNTQLWQFARDKIEHEDKWIQQRVSWNLASTSFLLAAYSAAALTGAAAPATAAVRWLLIATIPLLGLFTSLFVLLGLAAAWVAQDNAVEEWRRLTDSGSSPTGFPDLHSKGAALVLGKVAAWGTTIAAFVMWAALLACTPMGAFLRPGFHWR